MKAACPEVLSVDDWASHVSVQTHAVVPQNTVGMKLDCGNSVKVKRFASDRETCCWPAPGRRQYSPLNESVSSGGTVVCGWAFCSGGQPLAARVHIYGLGLVRSETG